MGQALSSPDIIPNAAVTPCAGGSAGSEPECLVSICNQRRWVLREALWRYCHLHQGASLLGRIRLSSQNTRGGNQDPVSPAHRQRVGNTGSKETSAMSARA